MLDLGCCRSSTGPELVVCLSVVVATTRVGMGWSPAPWPGGEVVTCCTCTGAGPCAGGLSECLAHPSAPTITVATANPISQVVLRDSRRLWNACNSLWASCFLLWAACSICPSSIFSSELLKGCVVCVLMSRAAVTTSVIRPGSSTVARYSSIYLVLEERVVDRRRV